MKSQQRFRRTHFTDRLLFGRVGFVISRSHAPLPFALGAFASELGYMLPR